jgi:AraC family transcriptional activator FtrA
VPHRVTVLAHPGLAAFELGIAAEVFALPRPELGPSWSYDFAVCAERPGRVPVLGGFALEVAHGLEALAEADTMIVPGAEDPARDPSPAVVGALRAAHARGARLVSFCSGAFVLAATGVLDGLTAATHWRYAELLARRFPAVTVTADVLYVDHGRVLTSAGTAAGIDLCLHVVRRDHGAAVANRVARRMVVPPHREGGQAQFVEAPVPAPAAPAAGPDPVAAAMAFALARLAEPLAVADLARAAHVSERTLTRRFEAATGTSPARWLLGRRIAAALPLLEASDHPVEHVGALVGLPSPAGFRRHFARVMGVPPSAWRRAFAAQETAAPATRSAAA